MPTSGFRRQYSERVEWGGVHPNQHDGPYQLPSTRGRLPRHGFAHLETVPGSTVFDEATAGDRFRAHDWASGPPRKAGSYELLWPSGFVH